MSSTEAHTAIWSNNPALQSLFVQADFASPMKFFNWKGNSPEPYLLVLIDLQADLRDISQRIISIYDQCRAQDKKLSVAILHGERVDREKVLYFSQLLDQLSGTSPIHRLIFVKDLYYSNLLDSETWLEKYILESLVKREILVSSKGGNKIYPLTSQDFVLGLQKTFFLSGTAGKIFWLVGDPFSDLDLAYLIRKNLEDSKDHFEIEATKANSFDQDLSSLGNQSRAILNWEPTSDFVLDLRSAIHRIGEDRSLLLSSLHHAEKVAKHPRLFRFRQSVLRLVEFAKQFRVRKGDKKQIENGREYLKKVVEAILSTAALAYLVTTLVSLVFTLLSLVALENSLRFIRNEQILASVKTVQQSITFGKVGEASYNFVSPAFSLLAPDFHEKNHNLFVFLHYSQTGLENLQQTYLLAEKVYQSIGRPDTSLDYQDVSLVLRSNLSQIYENITQISLLTKTGKLPIVLESKVKESSEFKNLSLIEQQVTQLLKSIELLPAFFSGDDHKNIVLVFQNTSELRSTGGVIDYLLTLVLDHGRIVSQNLYTASEVDDLIAGTIVAPPLISLYTGSDSWKVRDLNYNPDYTATAANLSAVIEKSLKFKPDVIVALNETLISDLLLGDKGIVLNGQNVTVDTFEKELVKVSPSPVYRQLISYYLDQIVSHKVSLISFGRMLAKQTLEGQMLVWTADDNIEKSIVDQAFSGGVFPHNCHPAVSGSMPCLSETTYLNESNFSLVPVGRDLKKKVIHKVSFSEKGVNHEYLVDYSFANTFPNLNRDLSGVIQVYAPTGSKINQVLINDKALSTNSIQEQQEDFLVRFQVPLSLKFNVDNHLVISFTSPLPEGLQLPFAYSLTEYRQPGLLANEANVQLLVLTPSTARATRLTAPATSTPDGYGYLFPSRTSTFGISFDPKPL